MLTSLNKNTISFWVSYTSTVVFKFSLESSYLQDILSNNSYKNCGDCIIASKKSITGISKNYYRVIALLICPDITCSILLFPLVISYFVYSLVVCVVLTLPILCFGDPQMFTMSKLKLILSLGVLIVPTNCFGGRRKQYKSLCGSVSMYFGQFVQKICMNVKFTSIQRKKHE